MALVSPGGAILPVMQDAGSFHNVGGLTLTLDDEAAVPVPKDAELTSGRFKPANYDPSATDPIASARLAAFDDDDPPTGNTGGIFDGWELTITAEVKDKGKRKGRR